MDAADQGHEACRRIALWSGPRNISTAMMRSWGNRPDTFVCDEPLYAHYLLKTGVDHPGREEVIAHKESDWRKVVCDLTGPIPGGKSIHYQKHMAHHLLPEIDRAWLSQLTNGLLIRHPAEMLVSLTKVTPNARLVDTGLPQQVEILEYIAKATDHTPPIVDAHDVLENPRRMLTLLCDALDVEFSEAMLAWPAGPRATDGVWAKHWYSAVEKSTEFEPHRGPTQPVPEHIRPLLDECKPYYERLHARRLGQ